MGSLPLIAAVTDTVLALILIGIAIPLALGKIPLNRGYGIRSAKSMESEALWFRINKYGGKQLIIWSIPIAVLGLATLAFPVLATGPRKFFLVTCAAPLICIIIAAVASYRYAMKQ
jgi:uncharacterized membrane protein